MSPSAASGPTVNQSSPSRSPSNRLQSSTSPPEPKPNGAPTNVKHKAHRARIACMPCRSRRSKCEAHPPASCPACLAQGIACVWPSGQGTKRGRPRKRARSEEDSSLTSATQQASTRDVRQTPVNHRQSIDNGPPAPLPNATISPRENTRSDQWILPQTSSDTAFLFQPPLEASSSLAAPPNSARNNSASLPTSTFTNPSQYSFSSVADPLSASTSGINEPLSANGLPSQYLIQHVFDIYFLNFGSRFPFYTRVDVDQTEAYFPFLFHCMAALALRFSTRTDIIPPGTPKTRVGESYYILAKNEVGHLAGAPSRKVVHGMLMLVEAALGYGSPMEAWIFMGMAVRLAMAMRLHLSKPIDMHYTALDAKLDRLLFWSVLIMDHQIAFQQGRMTTIRPEEITQDTPKEDDIAPVHLTDTIDSEEFSLPSPFRNVAEMMILFGALSNILLRDISDIDDEEREKLEAKVINLRSKIAGLYDELPMGLLWNAANLQMHHHAHQGQIYLLLHIWDHTVQSMRYLYSPGKETEDLATFGPTGKANRDTLLSVRAASWLHCPRFIGDMLVLADIIDPHTYLAVPSICQCFVIAGRCFLEDLKRRMKDDAESATEITDGASSSTSPGQRREQLTETLFRAVAVKNIKRFKKGLLKQAAYWESITEVHAAFETEVGGHLDTVNPGNWMQRQDWTEFWNSTIANLQQPQAPYTTGTQNSLTGQLSGQMMPNGFNTHYNPAQANEIFLVENGLSHHSQISASPSNILRMLGIE